MNVWKESCEESRGTPWGPQGLAGPWLEAAEAQVAGPELGQIREESRAACRYPQRPQQCWGGPALARHVSGVSAQGQLGELMRAWNLGGWVLGVPVHSPRTRGLGPDGHAGDTAVGKGSGVGFREGCQFRDEGAESKGGGGPGKPAVRDPKGRHLGSGDLGAWEGAGRESRSLRGPGAGPTCCRAREIQVRSSSPRRGPWFFRVVLTAMKMSSGRSRGAAAGRAGGARESGPGARARVGAAAGADARGSGSGSSSSSSAARAAASARQARQSAPRARLIRPRDPRAPPGQRGAAPLRAAPPEPRPGSGSRAAPEVDGAPRRGWRRCRCRFRCLTCR